MIKRAFFLSIVCAVIPLLFSYCSKEEKPAETVSLEFRICQEEPAPGLTEMPIEGFEVTVFVENEAFITEEHVASAKMSIGTRGPQIDVTLTDEGREIWAKKTEENVGRFVAMIVDGKLVTTPKILNPVTNGKAVIWGEWNEEAAQRYADGLDAR